MEKRLTPVTSSYVIFTRNHTPMISTITNVIYNQLNELKIAVKTGQMKNKNEK